MTESPIHPPADHPGVIARPPLLYGVAFVVVLALRWFWPLPIFDNSAGLWGGAALFVLGAGIAIWGRRTLQAAGTNIDPTLPTTALVTSGPFRYSRNPLYLALTLAFLGLTLAINTWWGFVVLIPLLVVMDRGVIRREERYLEEKFGESYRHYRPEVRRIL
jgi:protein-S-isoprenylcysteine O-methyltransferase Ste14